MAQSTDDKILSAFAELVIKHGYQGTTTREIAKTAGINESTVFRHFSTKEEILNVELRQCQNDMEKTIAGFQTTDNLESDILRMCHAYIDFVHGHQAVFLMGIRDSYEYPKIREAIQHLPERMFNLLVKLFPEKYGVKVTEEAERQLQNIFLVLYGRMTMELTYPQFKYLGSEEDFIEKNLKSLVYSSVRWVREHQ